MKAALNAPKRDRFSGRPGGVDRGSTRHLSQAPARQLAGHSGAVILAISRDGASDGEASLPSLQLRDKRDLFEKLTAGRPGALLSRGKFKRQVCHVTTSSL
jgi:hypothetical protein